MSTEYIFGKNSVEALLRGSERSINKIYIASNLKKEPKIFNIIKLARDQKIPVTEVPRSKLDQMTGKDANHQGIVASVSAIDYQDLDDILAKISSKGINRLIVMLNNIEDPQNLGSIIRSSEVFGADAVIIPRHRSAGITASVVKASSGAVELIPIIQVGNLVNAIEQLKKDGYWIIGAEFEQKSSFIFDVDLKIPCAIVMGSEGKGLSKLVKDSCDLLVKIPQLGKTSSLNVANALSIILYEIIRQRKL